jgi:hypothetical protein
MKRLVLCFALCCLTLAPILSAADFNISIQEIRANESISGTVKGLLADDHIKYKVLVYVLTDQWYIHPYADQDEGLSWASITKGGSWRIPTVQRQFKASAIAALLVERSFVEPNSTIDLSRIPYLTIHNKNLKGTGDFGKL